MDEKSKIKTDIITLSIDVIALDNMRHKLNGIHSYLMLNNTYDFDIVEIIKMINNEVARIERVMSGLESVQEKALDSLCKL